MHEQSSRSICIEDIKVYTDEYIKRYKSCQNMAHDPIVSKASFLSHTNCLIHAR